jgi:hypothetical protein
MDVFPFFVGRRRVYVPFQLSDLKEIKKDLGSYTDAPRLIYPDLYFCDPNL